MDLQDLRQPSDQPTSESPGNSAQTGTGEGKRVWQPPELQELPPLTELTLQTGGPIDGGGDTGGGGSTVF